MKKLLLNPVNERLKYDYRKYLEGVKQKDIKSILKDLRQIRSFEENINFKEIYTFNRKIALSYVNDLKKQNFSLSTILGKLASLRAFLLWLHKQKKFRTKIDLIAIDYLNLSRNEQRSAKASRYQNSYEYSDIIKVIRGMPSESYIQKRNKAVISLQTLCALRVSELRTLKLVNVKQRGDRYFLDVNPKNMEVKFAKQRYTDFFPLPNDILENVLVWREVLFEYGAVDSTPLFPKIEIGFDRQDNLIKKRKFLGIKANYSITKIFKETFEKAGYPYYRPHSFRHTLTRFALSQTPAYMRAVSQTLGHSSVSTTYQSYGNLSRYEQLAIIEGAKINGDLKDSYLYQSGN